MFGKQTNGTLERWNGGIMESLELERRKIEESMKLCWNTRKGQRRALEDAKAASLSNS